MGMDLYHYRFTADEKESYDIGRKHIQLENIITTTVLEPDDNFVHNCITQALKKHNIPYQESNATYCHDFENGNYHVGVYNDETVEEFKRMNKIIDDAYGTDDDDGFWDTDEGKIAREKAYDDYNDFGVKVSENESYWKDKMVFSAIPMVTTYRVLASHEEINYARKPFREIAEKHIESYRLIMDNTKGDPDGSWVIFDRESEYDFKQLIRMIESEDMVEHLNTMLPIKDDELICIDW